MDEMDQVLKNGFIEQFNFERFSADIYHAMAAALDTANLVGFASYLQKRGDEERIHAQKFATYLADRNIKPIFQALPAAVSPDWGSILDAGRACFEAALFHERKVTERIHVLYSIAEDSEDPNACVFLHWFITEQLEEEKTLDEWLTRFEIAKGCSAAYLALDTELRG